MGPGKEKKKDKGLFSAISVCVFFTLTLAMPSFAYGNVATQDDTAILAVTYFPYPPYIYAEEGRPPTGPHILRFLRITDRAGFQVKWHLTTVEGETRMLDQGRRSICSTGKLYNTVRAKKWTYLPYVFAMAPRVVVMAKSEDTNDFDHRSMLSLLMDRTHVGALLGGATYGEEVDQFLAENPDWILRTGKTDIQLIDMVLKDRADYAVVQEMQWHIAKSRNPAAAAMSIAPSIPPIPKQPIFLACSRDLPEETLARLGKAMIEEGFPYQALPN